MRILFGIQATGNGHIARSREVVVALRRLGHDVEVLFSGRPLPEFWRGPDFGAFQEREGITFVAHGGRVRWLATARGLGLRQLVHDIRSFDTTGYDLALCDFEPLTARIARRAGIASIGIGHQYAFAHRIPVAGFDPVAHLVLDRFAPTDVHMGLHWHHFGAPLLPPILSLGSLRACDSEADKTLVYLHIARRQEVVETLTRVREQRFVVYCATERERRHGNVVERPFSREGMLEDLATSSSVICHAGFELPSEALHLGKRVLVIPVRGQFEQACNALALTRLGLGRSTPVLDAEAVRRWLASPAPAPMRYPDVAGAIAASIDSGSWARVGELSTTLWRGVPLPGAVPEEGADGAAPAA